MSQQQFGLLLSEGVRSVKARMGWSIGKKIEPDLAELTGYSTEMVRYWRKGNVPKEDETIKKLARYVWVNGRLDLKWLISFIHAGRVFEAQTFIEELAPQQNQGLAPAILHNLPPQTGQFLGRESEMAEIFAQLDDVLYPVISIEGIGGIGKTTLATEVARRCLMREDGKPVDIDDPFEACVYLSAKEQPMTLNALLDGIARYLNYPYIINQTPAEQKPEEVRIRLKQHRTLIIADNFETVTDEGVFKFLRTIPSPSKAILTTRYGQFRTVWAVPLQGLPEEEAIQLIRLHGERLRLTAVHHAPPQDLLPLYQVTGGNPYALSTALGYMKHAGLSLESLVNALHQASHQVEGIFNYIFAQVWQLLSQEARHLLMAMTFFIESASKTAVSASAGVDGYYRDQAIQQLVELSLFNSNGALKEDELRYSVHPLTLAFARHKLAEHLDWEQEARERWLAYMTHFACEYGGSDWDEWGRFEYILEELNNLLFACHWALDTESMLLCQYSYEIYDQIEDFIFRSGFRDEDQEITEKALEFARNNKMYAQVITLLRRRGWLLLWLDRYEEAERLLKEAIMLSETSNDAQNKQHALHYLGVCYWRQGDIQRSIQISTQAYELAKDLEDTRHIISGLYYLGCEYYTIRHIDYAWDMFKKMEKLSKELSWYRAMAYASNRLADICLMRDQLEEARELLDKNIQIAVDFRDKRREAFFHRSFAMLEDAEGNQALAYEPACQSLDIFTRLGMKQEITEMEKMVQQLVAPK